jgi:predicted CoA-binding protein
LGQGLTPAHARFGAFLATPVPLRATGACATSDGGVCPCPNAKKHDSYTDAYIAAILAEARTIAMVGASATGNRPSYFAMKYLLAKGYDVIPVNPTLAGQKIQGRKVYAGLADLSAPVDIVDIFRGSAAAMEVAREAIRLKDRLAIKVVWMQLGVRNDKAAAEVEAAGLKVVMNRCPKIEYGRLSGEIGWAGVNAGLLSSRRPLLSGRGVQSHVITGKR